MEQRYRIFNHIFGWTIVSIRKVCLFFSFMKTDFGPAPGKWGTNFPSSPPCMPLTVEQKPKLKCGQAGSLIILRRAKESLHAHYIWDQGPQKGSLEQRLLHACLFAESPVLDASPMQWRQEMSFPIIHPSIHPSPQGRDQNTLPVPGGDPVPSALFHPVPITLHHLLVQAQLYSPHCSSPLSASLAIHLQHRTFQCPELLSMARMSRKCWKRDQPGRTDEV